MELSAHTPITPMYILLPDSVATVIHLHICQVYTNFVFYIGIQQSPAVGLAISELILDGNFRTVDLSRLGFDRILLNKPMYEIGII